MSVEQIYSNAHVTFEIASEHASTGVPLTSPGNTIAEVRQAMIGQRYETASLVVVCENGYFKGVLRIEDLLAAPADARVDSVMDREPPIVAPGLDQEVAAWHAIRNEESALSVVDAAGRFVGVIPPHRMLAVILSEHEEDLSRIGGFTKTNDAIRATSEEPVQRRFRHRLPWLLVGLAGSLLAADFVGWFETQLQQKVMLAFFIPGIVYLADAVGTQTETIVVRGLSVGVSIRQMLCRELLSGLTIGIVLGAAGGLLVWWRWNDSEVALVVGLALLAACSTATLAAMAVPWLLDKFDFDPAFSSGPLATVIQDLSSILIYFAIATAVIR